MEKRIRKKAELIESFSLDKRELYYGGQLHNDVVMIGT